MIHTGILIRRSVMAKTSKAQRAKILPSIFLIKFIAVL
jgi:hypothetical protein